MNDAIPILEAVDLTKHFGMVAAADEINVQISQGEFVGVVGANGSGKTTFINLTTHPVHGERYDRYAAPRYYQVGPCALLSDPSALHQYDGAGEPAAFPGGRIGKWGQFLALPVR
jgi:hypothetical protein